MSKISNAIYAAVCGATLLAGSAAFAAETAAPMAAPASGTYQYRGDAIITKLINNAGTGNPNACTTNGWAVGDTFRIRMLPADNGNITVNGTTFRLTMLASWSATNLWIPNFASFTVPSMTEIVMPGSQQLIVGKGYANFTVGSGLILNRFTPAPSAITTATNYIYVEFKLRNFWNAATTADASGVGNNGCDVTARGSMVLVP